MANITKEQIYEELENVMDPELGIDIINLGLVYDILLTDNHVRITMTMTSIGCPLAGQIIADIKETLSLSLPSLQGIDVNIVWTPSWTKERMSRYAKIALGVHG
ncbi:metal-sulfur cluster assembly factor [Ectobacillus polymachus]|uniref:metal-sulfur cluster assembly factor n=1 Tax=Ectobacillus polymachus TaxID=1508806 RepID=UPI003A8B7D2A